MRHMPQDVVYTVRDQHGVWALMTDEAKADLYAAQVHGVRGPDMTREQAEKLVAQSAQVDEAALQRMTDRGQDAWRDVPCATRWVDDLRGGEDAPRD